MQKSLQRRYGVIVGAAVVAIMMSFLIAAHSTRARRQRLDQTNIEHARTDHVICQRVNHIYFVIQGFVRQSIKDTPKIAYYQTHPADLAKVQQTQRDELQAFAPQTCPKEAP